MRMCLRDFLRLGVLSVGVATMVGLEPSAARAAEPDSDTLEEVVVTARQREETIQNIPITVTAFSAEDIARRGVVDMRDIAALTPGFSFQSESGSGYTRPVIRGAAQVVQTLEQNVSFFLDGIYLPRNYLTNLGFDLVDRVEVIEGPQSARYGRNAFIGAVNYVSRRPTEEWMAETDATFANHDSYTGTAFVSGSVIPGLLKVFGGVDYKIFGGTWPNLAPYCNIPFSVGTGCELGRYEHATYNLQAEFTPNDRLTLDTSYYRFRFNDQGNAQNWFAELGANSGQLNCGEYNATVRPPGSGLGGGGQWYRLYCGAVPAHSVPQDPRGYAQQLTVDFWRGGLDWKINDDLSLHDIAGYVGAVNSSLDYKDNPGCPFFLPGLCVFEDGPLGSTRQTSNEVRVTFDPHRWYNATLGAQYSELQDYSTSNFVALPPLTSTPTAPLNIFNPNSFLIYATLSKVLTYDSIWSGFGELNFTFLDDKAHIGIEARYQSEHKTNISLPTAGGSGLSANMGQAFVGTFSSFTPRYTIDYHLTKENMVYGSAAKGEHAGGFNTTSISASNDTYGPDQNWTYELGTKNTLAEGRVVLNADVFYVYWQDEQITSQDPFNHAVLPLTIIRNLGTTYTKGLEVVAAVKPIQPLTVSGNLALTDATFAHGTRDESWDRGNFGQGGQPVCDNVVCYQNGYIGGKQTPYSSKVQANLSAEWRAHLPIGTALEWYARADATYQSKQYDEDINISWIPGRTLVNAAAGLVARQWEVQLWARNLFDKEYVSSVIVGQPNMQYNSYLGDRETYGVTLKYRFR